MDILTRNVKNKSLIWGLDLKGGMNVTLEVSVGDILKILANKSSDATFNQAIDRANQKQSDSQNDYIDDFISAFNEVNEEIKPMFYCRHLVFLVTEIC